MHQEGDDRARGECQRCDCSDRPGHSENVGDDSGGKCTDRVAKVAPKSINTERACLPSRLRSIGNCGNQTRIYHRGADAEQQAADQPVLEVMCQCGEQKPCGPSTHIPATIRPFRPHRSLNGPVATCKMPQVAG